ncbi:MAG: dihydrofolate reductase [Nevskia sp.]|nr:dihydrofolate reductase [Nevskia sp.]
MSDAAGTPELILVVAVAENGVIGRNGALPWRLPDDLKRFRRLTLGKTLLMGRRTFDSLGKPLDGRDNWVLSADPAFHPPGVRVFASLGQALAAKAGGELVVIGGADLYRQTLPLAARLELTLVHAEVEGDTRMPALDPHRWMEVAREDHPADARHAHAFSFVSYSRKPGR